MYICRLDSTKKLEFDEDALAKFGFTKVGSLLRKKKSVDIWTWLIAALDVVQKKIYYSHSQVLYIECIDLYVNMHIYVCIMYYVMYV